jgi:hypothetical protein
LDQVEQTSQQKPSSVESDCHQDGKHKSQPETILLILEWLLTDHPLKIVGDSGPTERQVSPEKRYRAALLKNRFADTILKAREKTFPQVGYGFGLLKSFPIYVSLFWEHYRIWM